MLDATRNNSVLIAAMAAIALLLGTLAYGPLGSQPATAQPTITIDSTEILFPRTRLTTHQGHVMRMDTATGELTRFSGNLTGPAARGNWVRFARPVTQRTSGYLEIQREQNTTFLVGVIHGDTWVLRQRGMLGTWVLITPLGER
jgi:hypothetical protein